MTRYIGKRLLTLIPVLLIAMFVVYGILWLTPGDPARMLLGTSATEERVLSLRAEMGLDDPFFVQFFRYVWNVVTKFHFGTSYQTKQDVTKELIVRLPITMKLSLFAVLFSSIVAIPIGVYSAIRQYSALDYLGRFLSTVLIAIPTAWLGLVLMILFSNKWGILPSSGVSTPAGYILPTITLGAYSVALYMRITRSSMLEVIREDYIRTARGKGIGSLKTIFRHALKNASLPVITIIGVDFGACMGGAIVIENVFSIPGLGRYMVAGIRAKDTPAVLGSVMLLAMSYCILNLLVDIVYALLDPRIHTEYLEQAAGKKSMGRLRRYKTLDKGSTSGNN